MYYFYTILLYHFKVQHCSFFYLHLTDYNMCKICKCIIIIYIVLNTAKHIKNIEKYNRKNYNTYIFIELVFNIHTSVHIRLDSTYSPKTIVSCVQYDHHVHILYTMYTFRVQSFDIMHT